ncbi:hypothetical protein D3C78_1132370 [compost metagenome]
MEAGHLEVLAVVLDLVDLGRVGEQAALAVAYHRVLLPAALEQLVEHLQVFVGVVVALVVAAQRLLAEVARAAVQVGGDDVPADAALGQMVQGGEAAGERIRVLEGERGGQAEAEVLGDQCHRGDQRQRIVDRHLGGLADRRVAVAIQHVVDADHVGDEDAVELAALQQLGQLGPVFQVLVLPGAVARVRPQAGGLVADAVHLEGVEADFAGHGVLLERCEQMARATGPGAFLT